MNASQSTIPTASLIASIKTAVDFLHSHTTTGSLELQTRIEIAVAQLRLSRLGKAIELHHRPAHTIPHETLAISKKTIKDAEDLLGRLVNHVGQVAASASSRACTEGNNEMRNNEEVIVRQKLSLIWHLQDICQRRQYQMGGAKEVRHVSCNQDHIPNLASDISKLVGHFAELFPVTMPQLQDLCDEEAAEMIDEPALPTLKEIAARHDKPLDEAIARLLDRSNAEVLDQATTYEEYSVDDEIVAFFSKTTITQAACHARARELVGGPVTTKDTVVQFRLKSLALPLQTMCLAQEVFGLFAPRASFEGELGVNVNGKEPLLAYVLSRIEGVTYLDYMLANESPEHAPENHTRRLTLVSDVARFFSLAWKAPQHLNDDQLAQLRVKYERDLRLLLAALPTRFTQVIEDCLKAIPAIMSLPMVLLHKDFGDCNVMVDKTTCHLTGVIDWAEAEIGPFGLNLYSMQRFMGWFQLRKGWVRFDDYDSLHERFWGSLQELGDMNTLQLSTIRSSMVLGLLLSRGFTSRLANMPEPTPIRDDESGAYNMLHLDGLLIQPATRIADLS